MAELREVFEMTVKQMGEPDLDSWREQERRQRKTSRNKRLGAIAVAAVLLIAAVVVGVTTLGSEDPQLAPPGPEPSTSPGLSPGQTLSIIDVSSGTATPFTAPAGAADFDFTRDGSMVAYTDLDENGDAQVFAADVDGSNVRQLTHVEGGVRGSELPSHSVYGGLDWSPDGTMIAYELGVAGEVPQIYTVRISDGVSTRVSNEPDGAVDPGGWTPDGGSLVISSPDYSINHYSALLLDLGTGRTELIVPDGSTPELSPDGAWIAFNSWLKQPIRLILANSDGSGRHVIARFGGDDGYQEWSPDSTRIAFVADMDEKGFGTHIYDLVTGKTRFVTDQTVETWIDNDHILVSPTK
ncbi:MAG TPA: hypothetical protein VFT27_12425 [Actinomycetota bacterium]|nr:hypothetical protein [Actinomycetota bacterium]